MTEKPKRTRKDVDEVIIRPYPKVILLYPTALCALVCGAIQQFFCPEDAAEALALSQKLGLIFFVIFGLNLLVFSFEFTRLKSLAIGLGTLAVVFLCLWLGEKWPVIQWLREFVARRDFTMS